MKKYFAIMSRNTKLKCLGIVVLAMASSLLASVWPVRLGALYTNISSGTISTIAQGLTAVVSFGLIYLAAECITIIRRVALDCVIATHEAEIRDSSIEKLLKMPVAYYSGTLSGEKTAQLNQGVAGFSQLIKIMCNDIVATVLTAAFTLVQVFLNAPGVMVGIMLAYLAVTVIVSVFQIRSQNGIRESIVAQKNTLDGQICQSISNLELIRSMNAEGYEKRRLLPGILNISQTEKKHHRYMGAFDCLKQCFKILFQVGILVVSVLLISQGRMNPGAVITVCLLFQQLVKPIDEVYRFMDETASSAVKARALLEVVSEPADEIFSIESRCEKDPVVPFIRLEDVIITNPERDRALAWYEDLKIPCGRKVALKGASGCGKTTMIRCLNRFYPHMQGTVSLFGRALDTYSQEELTSLLYYVPQSTFFFAGTLRENLIYGLDDPFSDKQLLEALRKACLLGDDESSLCKDQRILDYAISEGAANLSGGQRQRLSLARAFLRNPRMYVFDESTANLDKQTADEVLTNIEAHAREIGAGIIYISHDKNVVERCDVVIAVNNKLNNQSQRKEAA